MFNVKIFQGSHVSTIIFYLEFLYQWNISIKVSELEYNIVTYTVAKQPILQSFYRQAFMLYGIIVWCGYYTIL